MGDPLFGGGDTEPSDGAYLVFLTYLDGETERRVNAAVYEKQRRQMGCTSLFRFFTVQMYQKWQTYTHCEIAVDIRQAIEVQPHIRGYLKKRDYEEECNVLAFGAFGGEGVKMFPRTFSKDGYSNLALRVTRSEMRALLDKGLEHIGDDYDTTAASWRMIMWPPRNDGRHWWCASLAHALLQQMDILTHYELNTLDVDSIVQLVKDDPHVSRTDTLPLAYVRATESVEHRLFGAYPTQRERLDQAVRSAAGILTCETLAEDDDAPG
jgi:hypothetical protein